MTDLPGTDPADSDFDPGAVLAALVRHRVDFVLIGGLAATSYGSPFLTQDVDVVPKASSDNWERLSAALTELGARVRTQGVSDGPPFDHTGESLAAVRVWNLTTDHGDLDVTVQPSGTQGFDDLVRDAEPRQVFGVRIAVASLADIVRSKQAANRPKDQRVLPTLREILATRDERG
jgi:hypothetical protein